MFGDGGGQAICFRTEDEGVTGLELGLVIRAGVVTGVGKATLIRMLLDEGVEVGVNADACHYLVVKSCSAQTAVIEIKPKWCDEV